MAAEVGTATLAWEVPDGNGCSVSEYVVEVTDMKAGEARESKSPQVLHVCVPACEVVLREGYVRIRARSEAGLGPWSLDWWVMTREVTGDVAMWGLNEACPAKQTSFKWNSNI